MTPTARWRPPTLIPGQPVVSITAREADVLAGIAHGHTNGAIAHRLGMSEDYVKTVIRRMLPKLGARNRSHAAALACSGQLVIHVNERKAA